MNGQQHLSPGISLCLHPWLLSGVNSWGDFRPASVSPTNTEGVANVPPELTLKSPPGPAHPQKSQHTTYDIQALPSPEKTVLQPLPGPCSESPGPSQRSWYHVAGSVLSRAVPGACHGSCCWAPWPQRQGLSPVGLNFQWDRQPTQSGRVCGLLGQGRGRAGTTQAPTVPGVTSHLLRQCARQRLVRTLARTRSGALGSALRP